MWRVKDDQASLEFGGLAARVSLVDPGQGLFEVQFGGSPIPSAGLLRPREFSHSGELDGPDFYVRGLDLVATYPQCGQRRLHRQIDWRPIHHPDLSVAGLEMVVSLRTDLLDDDATLHVDSEIPSVESLYLLNDPPGEYLPAQSAGTFAISANEPTGAAGLLLHRLANEVGTYVEIVHPTDFTTAQISRPAQGDARAETAFPLFAERLEKGVIRRARVQALFLPLANDQATARECYRRFANSPPPLTT